MKFLWAVSIFIPSLATAAPLGLGHVINVDVPKLELGFRSDLWTSPEQNKNNPLRIYDLQFKYPVLKTQNWKLSLTLATEGLRIGSAGLSVGRDKVAIGEDLRSQAVGFGIENNRTDLSSDAFFSSYSSDSDQPFQNHRDTAYDYTFIHRFVPEGVWQWVAGFDHTKNRGIYDDRMIPLLGVIYRPDADFYAILGFPFLRFVWTGEPWHKLLSVNPLGLEGKLSRLLNDFLTLEFRAGLTNRAYMHTQRVEDDKRIIYEEKYLEVSALRLVSPEVTFETSLGYSFGRRLYEARRVFAPVADVENIPADIYGTVKMGFQF
jgi:hypothetical protein